MILATHRFIAERKANFRRTRSIRIQTTFDPNALLLLCIHNEKRYIVVGETTFRIDHFVGEFAQWFVVGRTAKTLIQFVVQFVRFEDDRIGIFLQQILNQRSRIIFHFGAIIAGAVTGQTFRLDRWCVDADARWAACKMENSQFTIRSSLWSLNEKKNGNSNTGQSCAQINRIGMR